MLKREELLIARDNPSHLKVVSELDRRFLIAHEEVLLQGGIRLTLHQREALETATLVNRKD
jgi:hypothetical protein